MDNASFSVTISKLQQTQCSSLLHWTCQDIHPQATVLRPVVYRLCFLHALLLGRRRFGSLGWVSPVDFSASDLAISLQQLQAAALSDALRPLPWTLLQHLVADVNYGGRVTNEWDRSAQRPPEKQFSQQVALTVQMPSLTYETAATIMPYKLFFL